MDEVSLQKSSYDDYLEFCLAPSLEELSSFAIAVELWREEIKQKDPNGKLIVPEDWNPHNKPRHEEEIKKKLRKELPMWVPSKILEIVKSCLEVMECEMYRWTKYYHKQVAIKDITFCDLLFCIWLPNGLIDEHNTALNMLSNPSRSFRDKFKIMCIFCLEDEIKKLSVPLGPSIEHHYNDASFPEHTYDIVNYWISFMKRFHALSTSIPRVEMEFWGKEWQPPLELLTWIRFGYEYDSTTYIILLEALLETSAYRVKQIEYLIELWNNSPDRFKSRSRRSTNVCEKVFQMHVNWKRKTYRKPCSKDFEFLWTFLSSGSTRFRRNFLFIQQLSIVFMDFSTIDQLFEICLPNVGDFVEYKRFLTNLNNLEHLGEIEVKPCMSVFEAVAKFILRYFPEQNDRERVNFISKFTSLFVFDSEVEHLSVQSYLKAIQLVEKNNDVQPYRFHL